MQARLIKTSLVLVAGAIAASCTQSLSQSNYQPSPTLSPMSLTSDVIIKQVTLQVSEEKFPPDGVAPKRDRPIHSAAVFIELENLKETDSTVRIQKIEIKNSATGRVELLNQQAEEILLRPLQNSTQDFHLTQPGTYSEVGKVKAIITLQINDKTQVIESDAVEVQR